MTLIRSNWDITQPELAAFLSGATSKVFSTMLGVNLQAGAALLRKTESSPTSGVISLVGITGMWVGTGSLACTGELACKISSLMLLTEYEEVNEDVLDAVAELTNMIVGNVKTAVEDRVGPLGISIPTVIFGESFRTRNAGNHDWLVVPFDCEGEKLHVQMCLLPDRQKGIRAPRLEFPMPPCLNATQH